MLGDQRCDLLLAVMGAPHQSSQTTTLLRLARAALERGARVKVWTCGYATLLTAVALEDGKPRNLLEWGRHHPSAHRLVRDLLAAYPGQIDWLVCRFCSDERGATPQGPDVTVEAPMRFGRHVAGADKTLMLGTI